MVLIIQKLDTVINRLDIIIDKLNQILRSQRDLIDKMNGISNDMRKLVNTSVQIQENTGKLLESQELSNYYSRQTAMNAQYLSTLATLKHIESK